MPNIAINPNYKDIDFKNEASTLNIDRNMDISYVGSVEDEFGQGDVDSLIQYYLNNRLAKCIADSSCFTSVIPERSFNWQSGFPARVKLDDDTVTFKIFPLQDSLPNTLKYRIFLKDVKVVSKPDIQFIGYGFITIPIPRKPLVIEAKFLLWNQQKNEAVAWGKVKSVVNEGPAVTISTWERVTAEFAGRMFRDTKFSRNK
jgi:hypothetical protein